MKKGVIKKNLKRKIFLISILFIVLMLSLFWSVAPVRTAVAPHTNKVDFELSLYSGDTITNNARLTHPQFAALAFNDLPPKPSFVSAQLAAAARLTDSFSERLKPFSKKEDEYGTWIWTPILLMTPEYTGEIVAGAKANGVNVIYVSLDSYLDIFVLPPGSERANLEKKFSSILENFIAKANAAGIAVDAEAGWRNWAEKGHGYKSLAILTFVKEFNETREHKFRGFQYDVEPYLLLKYKINKTGVLKNFIELVDKTEKFIGADPLRFSVVIPDFYDEYDKATPAFNYDGRTASAFKHLLEILDRRKNSSIIVMSYRNEAEGDDGSVAVSANEMQTAEQGFHRTKIIIAQETGDFPPPYITFHGTSKAYLFSQLEKISKTFQNNPNFGGFAIHYVNSFLALD